MKFIQRDVCMIGFGVVLIALLYIPVVGHAIALSTAFTVGRFIGSREIVC